MNFNIGDRVVHSIFGVGTVVSIEGMIFAGYGQHLYYHIDFVRTTVWVPVGKQPERGLRPITPKRHLRRYRTLLKSSPVMLSNDSFRRRSELETRMEKGTFQDLCEVYRDLNAMKSLNNYEETLFLQAREALVLEWSLTSGLSKIETIGDIEDCLTHRK